jgi:hypothetical protein
VNYSTPIVTDTTEPRPFDERAALQELERLVDKIQSTRRQREQAEAQFETFVKAFRHDRYTDLINQHEAALVGTPPVTLGAPRVAGQSPQPARPAEPLIPIGATPRAEGRSRRRQLAVLAIAGAAIVVVAWIWRGSSTPPAAQGPSGAPAASAQPPAPQPPAPAAPARALTIELTTLRPVWMRVTVDGRRQIEREFPQGQKIPVAADSSIAIRAGDGGAVRLSLGGQDQGVLGKDGFPANKTLTSPQSGAR